jgi:hypothetical protein
MEFSNHVPGCVRGTSCGSRLYSLKMRVSLSMASPMHSDRKRFVIMALETSAEASAIACAEKEAVMDKVIQREEDLWVGNGRTL